MTLISITEPVNIDAYPKLAYHDIAHLTEITTGGLYSNAAKLLFILIQQHIIRMSPEDYMRLITIYHTPTSLLTPNILETFNALIKKIEVINKRTLTRLLGDELGQCETDYFVLKTLQKLQSENNLFETLLSSHNVQLILNFEDEEHCPALTAFADLVETGLVDTSEILKLVNHWYKKDLKLISYSLDLATRGITIFSYANINIDAITLLAEKFGIEYHDNTSYELAATIDAINVKCREVMLLNKLSSLLTPAAMMAAHDETSIMTVNNVLDIIVGNLSYKKQSTIQTTYPINYISSQDASISLTIGDYEDEASLASSVVMVSNEKQLQDIMDSPFDRQDPQTIPGYFKIQVLLKQEEQETDALIAPEVELKCMPPLDATWLDFSGIGLGICPDEGVLALLKCAPKTTTTYNLSSNNLSLKTEDEELAGIFFSIPKQVIRLDLRDNDLASMPFLQLKLALEVIHKGLLHLDLSDNGFENFSETQMAELLSVLPKTTTVTLTIPRFIPCDFIDVEPTPSDDAPISSPFDESGLDIATLDLAGLVDVMALNPIELPKLRGLTDEDSAYSGATGSDQGGRRRYGMYPSSPVPQAQAAMTEKKDNTI